jgi:hypothetical protein
MQNILYIGDWQSLAWKNKNFVPIIHSPIGDRVKQRKFDSCIVRWSDNTKKLVFN